MISLYYADFSSLDEEKLIFDYRDKIDGERLMKVIRTKAVKAKVRSLIAGYLLQEGVKDCLKQRESGTLPLQYRYSEQGKPYLVNYPDIYFNVSHSSNVAACAVSDEEIGLDIQSYTKIREGIANRFFTKEEQELLGGIKQKKEYEKLFFSLWSIKESYIKYTGLGMKQGLDTFRIDFEQHRIIDQAKEEKSRKPVYFQQLYLEGLPEYAVSVCYGKKQEKITMRKIEL